MIPMSRTNPQTFKPSLWTLARNHLRAPDRLAAIARMRGGGWTLDAPPAALPRRNSVKAGPALHYSSYPLIPAPHRQVSLRTGYVTPTHHFPPITHTYAHLRASFFPDQS